MLTYRPPVNYAESLPDAYIGEDVGKPFSTGDRLHGEQHGRLNTRRERSDKHYGPVPRRPDHCTLAGVAALIGGTFKRLRGCGLLQAFNRVFRQCIHGCMGESIIGNIIRAS